MNVGVLVSVWAQAEISALDVHEVSVRCLSVCLSVGVRPQEERVIGGISGVPPAFRVDGVSRS